MFSLASPAGILPGTSFEDANAGRLRGSEDPGVVRSKSTRVRAAAMAVVRLHPVLAARIPSARRHTQGGITHPTEW